MTPRFAQAVDPIFLYVLDLLDRINAGKAATSQDDHLRVCALIDQAEAIVGAGDEWELSRYALVSWIDEMLVDTQWEGREWWSNNVLEVKFFNTRLCNERFYTRALQASTLTRRDALEVYYNCVVLGFRGLYRDPEFASQVTDAHGLPSDLEAWARQTSMAIRLGQGRPPLSRPQRQLDGAPPLRTKPLVVWSWVAASVLAALNVICWSLLFSGT
jgi:type VI secretion system protein ImpK